MVDYMTYKPRAGKASTSEIFNGSGLPLPKLTPVRVDSNGDLDKIDVSEEDQSLAVVGVVDSDIEIANTGKIVSAGRIENIGLLYPSGTIVYVDKSGGLTNIKPTTESEGFLPGDFVIQIGIVLVNEQNLSNKDLLVGIKVVGQL